ncbi:MAG: methyltransferase domain-containing protein [Acidimicrobiia bacterium]
MDRDGFPPGFFDRADPTDDGAFYAPPRFVVHIDDAGIAAVGALYEELDLDGPVLDLMGSWVSHFRRPPAELTVLGMNAAELAANPAATTTVVHDLNTDPCLPFPDDAFGAAVCCVSVDYLVRPVEVFADVARVVRPGGSFVCTFSNRCFPTKAIRGWLATSDAEHGEIVAEYFRRAGGWDEPVIERRTGLEHRGDPLFAVWAQRTRTEPSPPLPQLAVAFDGRSVASPP